MTRQKLLILLCALMATITASAYDFSYEYKGKTLYFNKTGDGTCEVTYKKAGTIIYENDIIIPSQVTYNGDIYTVTSIGQNAFYGCKWLTSIEIPNTVTTIGLRAFFGCSKLTSIEIPSSVLSIDDEGFGYCTGLTSVSIPNSVAYIGASAFNECAGLKILLIEDGREQLDLSASNSSTFPFANCKLENLYVGRNLSSWSALCNSSSLKNVEIGMSVTSIGDSAFSGCSGLAEVIIPNSVTSIGDSAFSGCSGLAEIIIPESITSIGDSTFSDCSSLTSVTIPSSITSIGDNAFSDCTGLPNLVLPNSITSIGQGCFSGCSNLTSIVLSESIVEIPYYCFSACSKLAHVNIPQGVDKLGSWCFNNCYSLTSIEIPNSVTTIGYNAFGGCACLTSVIIPESVTSIQGYTFNNCSSLTSVTIPNFVTEIGYNAFSNCSSLTSVTIPESVASIGDRAFSGCSSLTSVTIPNSVTSIGSSAFSNCSSLTSVTIPNSITSIGDKAFYNTALYNNTSNWENGVLYISDCLIKANNDLSGAYQIKEGSRLVADAAFNGCNSLTSVTIPESIISIGESSYKDCIALTSITIPNLVTTIGASAFQGCSSLMSVTIPESVTSIGSSAFQGCSSLSEVIIPSLITSINSASFKGCSGLEVVVIGKSVSYIGDEAFYGCSNLKTVYNCSNMTYSKGSRDFGYVAYYADVVYNQFAGINGDFVFQNNEDNVSVLKYKGIDEHVEIPASYNGKSVVAIARECFRGNAQLKSVVIPNSITSIGGGAFCDCTNLKTLRIEDGGDMLVLYADSYTFYPFINCEIENLYVGRNLSSWKALCNSSSLTNVEIAGDVTTIGVSAFNECCGLTSVTIGNSVETIGVEAFRSCSSLTSLTIGNSVATIGNYAFYNCKNLTSLNLPETATSIGNYAFDGCSGLSSVIIPNSVTKIDYFAFSHCSNLTSVIIGKSVSQIGNCAFFECSDLKTIYNYSDLKFAKGSSDYGYVAYYADKVYNQLEGIDEGLVFVRNDNDIDVALAGYEGDAKDIVIPPRYNNKSVVDINSGCFKDNSQIQSVTLPQLVASIGDAAFSGCTSLSSVTIPNSLNSIGKSAFSGCGKLALDLSGNKLTIDVSVFKGIRSLIIGNNVTITGSDSNTGIDKVFWLKNEEPQIKGNVTYTSLEYNGCTSMTYLSSRFKDGIFTCIPISPSERTCIIVDSDYLVEDTELELPKTVSYRGLEFKVVELGEYLLNRHDNIVSLNINSDIEIVPKYFAANNAIALLYLPRTLSDIEEDAFVGCDKLKTIYNYSDLPLEKGSEEYGYAAYYADKVYNSFYALSEPWIYSRNGDALDITGYLGSEEDVIVPSSYNGLEIKQIINEAFANNQSVSAVTIPAVITGIGNNVFSNCSSLADITFEASNNAISLGIGLFSNCPIASLTIERDLLHSKTFLPFANNETLTDLEIGENVTYINPSEFKNCSNLSSVVIPDGVRTIGTGAFSGCVNLASVILPNALTSVADELFNGCSSIASIEIPNTVTSIGERAFYGCSNISEINLPNLVTKIGDNAFRDCSSLSGIAIPSIVERIGDNVLAGCSSLKELVFYDSANPLNIGNLCPDSPLEYVRIGRVLEYDNESPFANRQTLKTAWITDVPTSVPDYMFYNCSNLENVYVGDNVAVIGERAFSGCQSLKKFQFGKKVQSIGADAFSDCTGITDIYAEPSTPPTCGTQALDDLDHWTCTLHVPESAITAYQAAPQWKEFFFIDDDFQVAISEENISLGIGQSFMLTAVTYDDAPIRWESSNPAVAIVHPVDDDETPSQVNQRMARVVAAGEAHYSKCVIEIVGDGVATVAAFNGNDVMASCQINGKDANTSVDDIQISPDENGVISQDGLYTVYTINGTCLLLNGDYEAFKNLHLTPGIYIVNRGKILVK